MSIIKDVVDKCCKFVVKNILNFGLVYTTRVSLEVQGKINKEQSIFCFSYGRIYIDNKNTRVVHFYENILYLLQSGENILFDNIISYLNCNFVLHPLA